MCKVYSKTLIPSKNKSTESHLSNLDSERIVAFQSSKMHHTYYDTDHARLPKHDVGFELNPDIDEMDGVLHAHAHHHVSSQLKNIIGSADLHSAVNHHIMESEREKVNPWIYPKHHQEIVGRPDDYLGGCDICFRQSPRQSSNKAKSSWISTPSTQTSVINQSSTKRCVNHPSMLPILGHPVKNSPFLQMDHDQHSS